MDDKKIITFTNLKIEKKNNENVSKIPEDYIEIIPRYIEIYQGCWVKYTCKETGLSFPGGYLIEVTDDNVAILRNIRRDIFEKVISELPENKKEKAKDELLILYSFNPRYE